MMFLYGQIKKYIKNCYLCKILFQFFKIKCSCLKFLHKVIRYENYYIKSDSYNH